MTLNPLRRKRMAWFTKSVSAGTLAVFACFSSCSHHVVLRPYPMREDRVPPLVVGPALRLENGSSAGELLLGKYAGVHTYHADPVQWTDVVLENLSTELGKRGFSLDAGADRSLRVKLERAHLTTGDGFRCSLTVAVRTHDGQEFSFTGDNYGPVDQNRACAGAAVRVVEAILNHRDLRAYLAGEG